MEKLKFIESGSQQSNYYVAFDEAVDQLKTSLYALSKDADGYIRPTDVLDAEVHKTEAMTAEQANDEAKIAAMKDIASFAKIHDGIRYKVMLTEAEADLIYAVLQSYADYSRSNADAEMRRSGIDRYAYEKVMAKSIACKRCAELLQSNMQIADVDSDSDAIAAMSQVFEQATSNGAPDVRFVKSFNAGDSLLSLMSPDDVSCIESALQASKERREKE